MQEELSSLETGISGIPCETAADGRCRKQDEGNSRGRSWEGKIDSNSCPLPQAGVQSKQGTGGEQTPAACLDPGRSPSQGSDGQAGARNSGTPPISSPVPSLNHILSLFSKALVTQPRDLYQPHLVYPHNGDEEAEHVVLLPTSFSKGRCVCQCQGGWGRGDSTSGQIQGF